LNARKLKQLIGSGQENLPDCCLGFSPMRRVVEAKSVGDFSAGGKGRTALRGPIWSRPHFVWTAKDQVFSRTDQNHAEIRHFL